MFPLRIALARRKAARSSKRSRRAARAKRGGTTVGISDEFGSLSSADSDEEEEEEEEEEDLSSSEDEDEEDKVGLVGELPPSVLQAHDAVTKPRKLKLERGDIVLFRGEIVEHWIEPVTSGRRVILQVSIASVGFVLL